MDDDEEFARDHGGINPKEQYSRILKTPDGIDRVVSMPGWYWVALDWMDKETAFSQDQAIRLAFDATAIVIEAGTADNPDNFGAEFGLALQHVVWDQADWYIGQDYGANQNKQSEEA